MNCLRLIAEKISST